MARLNTHLSASQAAREATVDSLYREPTPQSRYQSNAPSSARGTTYSVMSPARSSQNSDKENQEPDSRENTPRVAAAKGKRAMTSRNGRLPTPRSGSSSENGNKRRRTGDYIITDSSQTYQNDDIEVHDEHRDEEGGDTPYSVEEEEETRNYDPQQDPDLRRQVRANIRQHHREIEDNRDELIQPGNEGLLSHIKKQDYYMGKVRQTADAALDSRVMVLASDLAHKKMNNTLNGNNGVGIDLDQFVSRCIHFMRTHGDTEAEDPGSTQARNRRRTRVDEEEADEDGGDDEGLDWAFFGREACFPFNRRPPVTSFLLGPLSVQKRARATQTRRARAQRQPTGPTTRPQELTQADIQHSETSNLTHIVKNIQIRLKEHIRAAEDAVEKELEEFIEDNDCDPTETDVETTCRRYRIAKDADGEAAVSLFDFVINPQSFGQTVENMFYISFLIREGTLKVVEDDDSLPLLVPSAPFSLHEQREKNVQKHQAVFSLDWPTWKKLIDAFDIKEPLIPHRASEQTTLSASGWYG